MTGNKLYFKSIYIIHLFLFLWSFSVNVKFAHSSENSIEQKSIEYLDQILDEAKSYDNFYSNSSLRIKYFQALQKYYLQKIKGSGVENPKFDNPDFSFVEYENILKIFNHLTKKYPELIERAWDKRSTRPSIIISDPVVKRRIFEFKDVSRRFHAMFRGLVHHECVGGDARSSKSLTPRRFLVPLLFGGHEIHLLINGRYTGYISETLIQKAQNKNTTSSSEKYLSLDIMTSELGKLFEIQSRHYSLFDQWLHLESMRIQSEGIIGFITSESMGTENENAKKTISLSNAFLKSKKLDFYKKFVTHDPFSKLIVDSYIHDQPTLLEDPFRMIYNATLLDSGTLYLLDPNHHKGDLKNISKILSEYLQSGDTEKKLIALTALYFKKNNSNEMQEPTLLAGKIAEEIYSSHFKHSDFTDSALVSMSLASAFLATHQFSSSLEAINEKFFAKIDWILNSSFLNNDQLLAIMLRETLPEHLNNAYIAENPIPFLKKLKEKIRFEHSSFEIMTTAKKAKSAKILLELLKFDPYHPNSRKLDTLQSNLLIDSILSLFFSLQPTIHEIGELQKIVDNHHSIIINIYARELYKFAKKFIDTNDNIDINFLIQIKDLLLEFSDQDYTTTQHMHLLRTLLPLIKDKSELLSLLRLRKYGSENEKIEMNTFFEEVKSKLFSFKLSREETWELKKNFPFSIIQPPHDETRIMHRCFYFLTNKII